MKLLWLARGLAFLAAGLAGHLWWATGAATGQVPGCGDESGLSCLDYLPPRWSYWLGMPVSLPALVAYAITFLALLAVGPRSSLRTRRDAWRVLLPLGALLGGAAAWFLFLQIVVLHRFCVGCAMVQACALLLAGFILWYSPVHWHPPVFPKVPSSFMIRASAAKTLLMVALAGLVLLVGGQVTAPSPRGMKIVRNATASQASFEGAHLLTGNADPASKPREPQVNVAKKPSTETDPSEPTEPESPRPTATNANLPPRPAGPIKRMVKILDGKVGIDPTEHPCNGSPQAEQVLVKVYDYTSSPCRTMHRYLEQARARYGDQLAIVLLPAPRSPACNRYVKTNKREYENSCAFARLALAVWKVKPEAFSTFHDWLLDRAELPTVEAAKKYAAELVGAAALEKAGGEEDVNQRLEANCRLYHFMGQGDLPKLIGAKHMAVGEPRSALQLFQFLEKVVGLKPLAP